MTKKILFGFRAETRAGLLSNLIICVGFLAHAYGGDASSFSGKDVLEKVRTALQSPSGHKLTVLWTYRYEGEVWEGEGTLSILGSDYLKLVLPYQEILVKKLIVMTRYSETDQVIIDYFDRNDPTSLFSILLGDFSGFSILDMRVEPGSVVSLRLTGETLGGFEELDMSVDSSTWIPRDLLGTIGKDMSVRIEVVKVEPLEDPRELESTVLQGSEVIDLRE